MEAIWPKAVQTSCTFALTLACCLVALPAWADTSLGEIAVLEQRVALAPADEDALFDLAMAYARTPKLERGWDALQRIRKLDPNYADKVIEQLAPLAKENPSNVEVWFRLAFAYYFKGFDGKDASYKLQARNAFEQILAVDPQYVWAMNYLAFLNYDCGDESGAMAMARKATAVDPKNAVSHFLLGEALAKQRQPFAAALEIAQAMQLRGLANLHP